MSTLEECVFCLKKYIKISQEGFGRFHFYLNLLPWLPSSMEEDSHLTRWLSLQEKQH